MQKPGGYENLLVYQIAVIIYDLTIIFCKNYLADNGRGLPTRRTQDQLIHAVRSGKQNIVEGSLEKSLKMNIKLTGVSRASYSEAIEDFRDFLRSNSLALWDKDDPRVLEIRAIRVNKSNLSNLTDWSNWTNSPESFANLVITLIHLENYLLDKLLRALEQKFITEGGYSENLFKKRLAFRN